jgi:hypothetical protein
MEHIKHENRSDAVRIVRRNPHSPPLLIKRHKRGIVHLQYNMLGILIDKRQVRRILLGHKTVQIDYTGAQGWNGPHTLHHHSSHCQLDPVAQRKTIEKKKKTTTTHSCHRNSNHQKTSTQNSPAQVHTASNSHPSPRQSLPTTNKRTGNKRITSSFQSSSPRGVIKSQTITQR